MVPGEYDELVASRFSARPYATNCWAKRLKGPAKEFVEALERAEDANPGTVWRAGASVELIEAFGVLEDTSIRLDREGKTLSRHLRRGCSCRT